MSVKIIAKSKKGDMFKIGETDAAAKWYYLGETEKFAARLVVGDEVEFKSSQKSGSNYLSFIKKVGSTEGSPVATEASAPRVTADSKPETGAVGVGFKSAGTGKFGNRDERVQELIVRQSVLSSSCNLVRTLEGQVDVENIGDTVEKLYRRLLSIVIE